MALARHASVEDMSQRMERRRRASQESLASLTNDPADDHLTHHHCHNCDADLPKFHCEDCDAFLCENCDKEIHAFAKLADHKRTLQLRGSVELTGVAVPVEKVEHVDKSAAVLQGKWREKKEERHGAVK